VPGSPAHRAGIQPGDLATKINGEPLRDETSFPKAINKARPGDSVQLTIVRDGQERTISVALTERPPA